MIFIHLCNSKTPIKIRTETDYENLNWKLGKILKKINSTYFRLYKWQSMRWSRSKISLWEANDICSFDLPLFLILSSWSTGSLIYLVGKSSIRFTWSPLMLIYLLSRSSTDALIYFMTSSLCINSFMDE